MKQITFILVLLVSIAQAQPNIVKMEYWIGTDPGFGAAINIPLSNQQSDISFIQSITPNLNQGINYLGYRSKDANNVWSHTNFLTLYVVDSTHSVITEVEYFWDVDSVVVVPFTSIADFSNQTHVQVYPNPFADKITIEPKGMEKMRVMAYDIDGKKVIDKVINSTTYIDTQTLISGTYLICVLTDNNKVYQFKMIKSD